MSEMNPAELRKMANCVPFADADAGIVETMEAMRWAANEIERLKTEIAKFAAFADKNGEPRKVPLTADGKLIVEPSEVWWWDGDVLRGGGAAMTFEIAFATDVVDVFTSPNAGIGAVYSTKQAAEAAKEKTQ